MNKLVLVSLVTLLLSACGGSDISTSSSTNASTTSPLDSMDLKVKDIKPAVARAPFGNMYGNYRITACKRTGREDANTNLCNFSILSVFGPEEQPELTALSFRRHSGPGSVEIVTTFYSPMSQSIHTSNLTMEDIEGADGNDRYAIESLGTSLRSVQRTTFTRLAGHVLLSWADSHRDDEHPEKDNHDYGYELTLEKAD